MLRRALLLGSTFFHSLTATTAVSIPSISLTDDPSLFRRDPNATQNAFEVPPPFTLTNDFTDNVIYPIGAEINVLWVSDWPSVDIALCQPTQGTSVGCELKLSGIQGKGYNFIVSNDTAKMYGFQDPIWSPDIYFLQLTPTNTQNPYIRSHYFNITSSGTNDSSVSTTASSAATIGTQLPTATGTTLSTASPSTTSAANATSFSSLSLGAKIGISISIAALAFAVLGAATFCLIRRHRKRRRNENLAKIAITESTSTLTSPMPPQEMDSVSYVHETGEALPHEISSKEVPIEMPAEIPGLAISTYEDEDAGWDWRDSRHNGAREREGEGDR